MHGARCTWWGPIRQASRLLHPAPGPGMLCCPHCGGLLLEVPTEAKWWRHVDDVERDGHVGFRALMIWLRGRCFPSLDLAEAAYRRASTNGGAA